MGVVLKVLQVILAVDVGVVLFCWLEERWDWLLNTQLALFSTLLIVVGSFAGYRRLVERRVEEGAVPEGQEPGFQDRWEILEREGEEGGPAEVERGPKERKKVPLWQRLLIGFGGAFTPLRLLGYGALIGSFLYLQNNYLFRPIPFLFGVSIVPALALVVSWFHRGD
jgi:hypothetical protein